MRWRPLGELEVFWGWPSPVQPNTTYITRFWGISYDAMFLGIVTAFERSN